MKLYRVCKAFTGHAAGDVIELDESNAATKALVELGTIAEAPGTADDLVLKAAERLTVPIADAVAKSLDATVKAINAGFQGKGIPAGRTEDGESEADRQKSLGHFFQAVGIAGNANSDIRERDAAFGILTKMYGSKFNSEFHDQWSQSAANGAATADGTTTGVVKKAALAEGSGTTGGYTVPPEYATRLLEFPPEEVVMVGQTDEYPMTGRELVMPVLDQTTASGTAGVTSYFGGVVARWTAEAQTRTETEPQFKDLRLVANELAGYALASRNVLMDNVVAPEQRLTTLFRSAIAWYRDYAYLQGDGVGKPTGVLSSGALIKSTRNTGSHLKFADLASMVSRMMPGSYARCRWLLSPSAYGELIGLVDLANRPVFQPILGPGGTNAASSPIATGILGRPYYVTEKLPALGTTGDLMLVDPKMYFSATRQDIEVAASEHYRFLNNQITFRFLFRGDGKSWMDLPFTTQDQSTTLSPFVALT